MAARYALRKHWHSVERRLNPHGGRGRRNMVKMSTVWDRTAEFLSDNIATLLPLALFAFFIPASIEGNFAAAGDGRAPGPVLGLRLIQIAFALLSLWGTLAITAMALDIAGEERPGAIALRRLPAAVLVSIVMLWELVLVTLAGLVLVTPML